MINTVVIFVVPGRILLSRRDYKSLDTGSEVKLPSTCWEGRILEPGAEKNKIIKILNFKTFFLM